MLPEFELQPIEGMNMFERSARAESIETGVAQLPEECILDVFLNTQGLAFLTPSERAMFTEDFFKQNTLMTVPLSQSR